MPHHILKFDTKDGPRYLEWSTVVDAPVTYGMPLAEFTKYWRKEYGAVATRDTFEKRLRDVEAKDTDAFGDASVDATIRHNRAGAGDTCLTKAQIIDYYCHRRGKKGPRPRGVELADG